MASELLEIRPLDLKFTFELKKQSSCSVQLINNSNHYVAFKYGGISFGDNELYPGLTSESGNSNISNFSNTTLDLTSDQLLEAHVSHVLSCLTVALGRPMHLQVKTTAPKKYCVRPNTGIVLPRTTSDFTVTMQAQKVAPSDLQCKDKFLVQSTIVPFGTTEEDLNANLFSKENGRFIEENKLRVFLVSPPHSPVLQPINGALKQEPVPMDPVLKVTPVLDESPVPKEAPVTKNSSVSNISSVSKETPPGAHSPVSRDAFVSKETPPRTHSPVSKESYLSQESLQRAPNGIENVCSSQVSKDDDVKNLTAMVNHLESKLIEAEKTISRLSDEKHLNIEEREKLQQEVVLQRRKCAARVQVGFPLLFVCFVALVGIAVGYLLQS